MEQDKPAPALSRPKFQSLKGLQPKWNVYLILFVRPPIVVSIPKRVTAKVEQERRVIGIAPLSVSIPKRVTAKVELMVVEI